MLKNKNKDIFYFFALAPTGKGLSGGDRIFIELAREWSKKIPVRIFTTQEGVEMAGEQKLSGSYLTIERLEKGYLPNNFFLKYIYKIFLGIRLGLTFRTAKSDIQHLFLYSSSDFWMDVLPAVILKTRFTKVKWIATWFQTAPNPLRGFEERDSENQGQRFRTYKYSALMYGFSQLASKPLITKFADKVIVNNEEEKKQFLKHTKRGDTIVLLGAVPLKEIKNWKAKLSKLPKKYDAVFQGRFHPQKGVVELVEIWKKVVEKKPNAKLAMIGDGPLMQDVRDKIQDLGLQKNIKLFGYLFDGPEKYEIFSRSKLVVHPAFYDSGGMASAEAMAFGIPVVGFDLKAYESYYPQGMLKVPVGDLSAFGDAILKLLDNDDFRRAEGENAEKMIFSKWSWNKRTSEVLDKIQE
ncbi:hypothetical protein A3D01_04910 [Candidatus Woesebacteria bacterium RIFCSPHIGHO2_02_FULL_39_13]|uniref:Glycosyl transferase family 1 domain-containing protein n=1 Tax=Candidatus Woesebacteria bacterium RIFCSPHIGHO2_02_FULL_39_13 TaxID=1802505 RepID=A0A1F7Z020_9BACT|nr:MAG: hypothetical protein A2692_00230 [Candidatus Woesebacteria bacterium RIFCSPHIGHO2_01_FULL_39_95]OGM32887.1 MAG: hypothetical protein A3D01_04910 [Candidatus Woesebacteria bacterium RIFCSPHIGHO2_02_FULL_39_13]OGM74400.1 MAG: hypothetical protein A3H19_05220 [Candidatus Woesebacteria bacterium RIFCSPLOWO2_12_FULL_39_9]